MTPARLAIATAAAALFALGAAGCGSQAGAPAGQPPKLSLASSASPTPGPTAPQGSSPLLTPSPAPPGVPSSAQVELTGRLPATGPASGVLRALPGNKAAQQRVRALAAALRMSGSPQRVTSGWRVTGLGTLQVTDGPGLRWTYVGAPGLPSCGGPALPQSGSTSTAAAAPAAKAGMGSSGQAVPGALGRMCPMGPGRSEPGDPVPAPSAGTAPSSGASAQAVAKPVLQAAGVAGSPLRITTIGAYTFVSADPAVDGLPTAGFTTTIGFGPGDRITQAGGWLSRPADGSAYPLVGARQAFNRLAQSVHPIGGARLPQVGCPLNPEVLCGAPGPMHVVDMTGAEYGLSLSYNRSEPVLVPSWLFSVAGTGLRIPQVAISPRYLGG